MASQSRIGLQTDINADIADNTTADITPADVRAILTDLNDSTVNKLTDTNLIGWYEFDATKNYYTNELVFYSNNLYKFNQNHSSGVWNASHADLFTAAGSTQFQASLNLSSSDILSLYTTPLTLISCPTGKSIIVTSASIKLERQITSPSAYATESNIWLSTATSNIPQVKYIDCLTHDGTYNAHISGTLIASAFNPADIQIVDSQNLQVLCPTSNPTTGNWSAVIYVTFRLI